MAEFRKTFEGLKIFKKYISKDEYKDIGTYEDDSTIVVKITVSYEDRLELEKIGWYYLEDEGLWAI